MNEGRSRSRRNECHECSQVGTAAARGSEQGCREERLQPPDPFRVLKSNELVPLAPVAMTPVGHYAYKITWSDGHDTGIYTFETLRELCQCAECLRNETGVHHAPTRSRSAED
jgi:DUF971 family protein